MKHILIILSSFLLLHCSTPEAAIATPIKPENVLLQCVFSKCRPNVDSVFMYTFEGIYFKKIQKAKVNGDTLEFTVPFSKEPKFYYVGTSEKNKKSVFLGQEEKVVMKGECNRLISAATEGSDINGRYASLTKATQSLKGEMNGAIRRYQQLLRKNPQEAAKAAKKIAEIDKRRIALLDSLKRTEPKMGTILNLESFVSFATDQKGYQNEILHYAEQYFKQVDLADPFYNEVPQVFESFRTYAQTLASTNMPIDDMKKFIDAWLTKIPEGAKVNRYALGGTVLGLQARNHPAFVDFGLRFVELYKADNSPVVNNLAKQLDAASRLNPGKVAPDFTQNTPEGDSLTLSSLKGKVVLVDFWASWCGPCRRENPNVVKLYNKYKAQGFDILGVSLDRKKEPWLKAIDKDGLPWHHVSDLRGWSNAAAQMYGVRSIPHTVLLDREGRIIARNLKGPQLEYKIDQLLNPKK